MKSVALNQEKQIGDVDDTEELLVMVNEALNNYITLMNFAYVFSRETDQSNRMNHTTVTDKHLGGLHLRKKSTFENQRPTRMCRMFLKHFIHILLLSLFKKSLW